MKVGENNLDIEAPDLIVMRIHGVIHASGAEVLSNAFVETRRDGRVFILSVLETSNFTMPGDARKALVLGMRGTRVVYDAVVGANFHVRVIARLVETAARALSGVELRLAFFDDEASARAWLREQGCLAPSSRSD